MSQCKPGQSKRLWQIHRGAATSGPFHVVGSSQRQATEAAVVGTQRALTIKGFATPFDCRSGVPVAAVDGRVVGGQWFRGRWPAVRPDPAFLAGPGPLTGA